MAVRESHSPSAGRDNCPTAQQPASDGSASVRSETSIDSEKVKLTENAPCDLMEFDARTVAAIREWIIRRIAERAVQKLQNAENSDV